MNQVQSVTKYERGTNPLLDAVYEESDGTLYVVQGSNGRMPILANSEEDAKAQYLAKRYRSIRSLEPLP